MPHLPRIRKRVLLPFLSTFVLLLSVITGVALVQQQQELRTKAAGNTYYIAPNGADGNSGTLSKPWRTIGKANQTLQAGDTVFIRSGIYKEPIKPSRSGSSSKRITYSNYNDESVIISGINDPLILSSRSYITIHGIEFRNVGRYLEMLNGHYNHIEYSIFTDSTYWKWRGMYIGDGSSHNWFHHNSISRHGDYFDGEDHGDMISIARGSDYNLFEDNEIFYGGHNPFSISSSFNVVRNNYFHNEEWKKGYGNRHMGAAGPAGVGLNLIEGNRFGFTGIPNDAPIADGFQLALSDNVLRFNDFYENKGNGVGVATYNGRVSDNNHIYNNVFYHNGIGLDPNEPVAMSNNVGLKFSSWDAQIKNTVAKNNIFYRNVGGPIAFQGGARPEDQTIVNNWENGDPLFVDDESPLDPFNPNLPDFRLQANSPAIDAGIHLTVTASSGSGISLKVDDAYYFSDGFGIVDADWIKIGVSQPVQIKDIDYAASTITIAEARTWSDNDPVWLYRDSGGNVVFKGSAPDLGAHEYGAGAKPTQTPTPAGPTPTTLPIPRNSFRGLYYDNKDFTNLTHARIDSTIDFDWGRGSPAPGVGEDTFSIRWEGDWEFTQAGTYRFTAETDDGMRVLVGGQNIIDSWKRQSATVYTADIQLSSGTHRIQADFYEDPGDAVARLSWARTSTPTPTTPTPPPLPGDINGDGTVNILDFQLLNNLFGTNNPDADLNNDGIVNILDFQILNNNFGKTGG